MKKKLLTQIKRITISACFLILAGVAHATNPSLFGEKRIVLQTNISTHMLYVQYAETEEALQHGLMERESLTPYDGMLFDFHAPVMASMWMKNTPMHLDMIFIKESGEIAHIVEETTPYSLESIASPEPVRWVLEMPSGSVKQYNITRGNYIEIP